MTRRSGSWKPERIVIGAGDVGFLHVPHCYVELQTQNDVKEWRPNVIVLDEAEAKELAEKILVSLGKNRSLKR